MTFIVTLRQFFFKKRPFSIIGLNAVLNQLINGRFKTQVLKSPYKTGKEKGKEFAQAQRSLAQVKKQL